MTIYAGGRPTADELAGLASGRHIASTSRTSSVTATTSETLADSVTFTAESGRRYKFTFNGSYYSTVAGDAMEYRVRTAVGGTVTTAGTLQRGQVLTCPTINGVIPLTSITLLTGLTPGDITVGIFLIRNSGSGTVGLFAGAGNQALAIVEDNGT